MIFGPTHPWRRRAAIAGIVLLGASAIIVAFDWNWLRGPLERYLAKESGREVRIGKLDIDFGFSLKPTIRLNDVFIQNAPWAASKNPFVSAREIAITVPLSGLFARPIQVPRIAVSNAQIDMERRADGLRNWRLRDPDDRSPGRIRVQTLEARTSSLQFTNAGIGLELSVSVSDGAAAATPDLPLHIEFKGRYQGRDFSGGGLIGSVVSFRDSGLTFPLRGHLVSAGTRLDVDGTASDVFDPGTIDVRAWLAGPSLAGVYPFLRVRAPESRPYALQTRIIHRDRVFRFEHITGRLGGTPGTAEVTYDRSGERPLVKAVLHSETADFGDVSPLMGLRSPGLPSSALGAREKERIGRVAGDPATGRPLPVEALRKFDISVTATAKRLTVADLATLENPRVEAILRDGVLEAQPITFAVAGGQGTGSIKFDAREASATATVTAELRAIQIERLVPALAREQRVAARLSGHVKLAGRGRSALEIVSSASGSAETHVESGHISNRIDARLGLDFGKLLRLYFQGDRDIAIGCGTLTLDVRNGIATTRTLALDTAATRVAGKGTINLRDQRIDLVLSPERKNPGLFTRHASIIIRGPLASPSVAVAERTELAFAGCSPPGSAARP